MIICPLVASESRLPSCASCANATDDRSWATSEDKSYGILYPCLCQSLCPPSVLVCCLVGTCTQALPRLRGIPHVSPSHLPRILSPKLPCSMASEAIRRYTKPDGHVRFLACCSSSSSIDRCHVLRPPNTTRSDVGKGTFSVYRSILRIVSEDFSSARRARV